MRVSINGKGSEGVMDTGEGKFYMYEKPKDLDILRQKHPKSKGVFTVGEELVIKGSRFQVKDISPYGIKLKLLPAQNKKDKICKIVNGRFSYLMYVDGECISFSGSYVADYLEKHYGDLGYKIERYKEE